MAGDTSNAAVWQGADVYVGDIVGAVAPTDVTSSWGASWAVAGLLDGESGFVMARDEETAEHYAWGGVLVKKTRRNHKRTISFTALEDNPVVFGLINPGSDAPTEASGLKTSVIKVPKVEEFPIGFELRDGDKVKRRTVKRATLEEVGEVTESESGLASVQITIVILTEADGELYREVSGTVS